MNDQNIKEPVPVKTQVKKVLRIEEGMDKAPSSKSPPLNIYRDLKTRSVTPNTSTYDLIYQNEVE